MNNNNNLNDQCNGVSVGIGTTGNCNLNCEHCYSKPLRGNTLTYDEIISLIEGKNITSINYGTGENILNPDFMKVVTYCYEHNIKQSLTSNGYSIMAITEEQLRMFNDIDISLEFTDESKQNSFRHGDSWNFVDKSIEKCRKADVEFSIATALMNINYKQIPSLLQKVNKEGCNLRLNVFKKVPKAGITKFSLTYDEFWEAVKLLFEYGELISCSEPVVNAMLDIPPIVHKSPCGLSSLRIHPDGCVVPCVYWPGSDLLIKDLKESFAPCFDSEAFSTIRIIPKYCLDNCEKVDVCGGGCAARRFLNGDINIPDEYCPIYLKKELPEIKVTHAKDRKDLVHSSYLCTFIFMGK